MLGICFTSVGDSTRAGVQLGPMHMDMKAKGLEKPLRFIWFIYVHLKFLILDILYWKKHLVRLVLGAGSGFLLDPTLNTSPEPHLPKNVSM
jgi:hypothetical protein